MDFLYDSITFFICSPSKNVPFEFKNFSPFQICGLCEAVIAIPPAAFRSSVAICTVGVGTTPISVAVYPHIETVDKTKSDIMFPCFLPSYPITIFFDFEFFLQYSIKAEVNLIIFSGVKLSPNIPRTPETDAIISVIMLILYFHVFKFSKLVNCINSANLYIIIYGNCTYFDSFIPEIFKNIGQIIFTLGIICF